MCFTKRHTSQVIFILIVVTTLIIWKCIVINVPKSHSNDILSKSAPNFVTKVDTNITHHDNTGKYETRHHRSSKNNSILNEEMHSLPEIDLKADASFLPKDILDFSASIMADSFSFNSLMDKLSMKGALDEFRDVLIYMMQNGNTEEKCAALFVIGSIWEKISSPSNFIDYDNKVDYNNEIKQDQWNQLNNQIISKIFISGLTSQDEDVRMQAAISLNELSDEISNPLCLFALSQEDADMKLEVLKPHLGSKRHEDITLFFHALDDDDATISGYAKENLNYVLGVTFETSDEAFEWWEHHMP